MSSSNTSMAHNQDGPEKKKQKVQAEMPISEAYHGMGVLLNTGSFSDVEVVVGSERRVFKLHKAVLSQNSGYFRKVLKNNNFKEGRESRVVLADHSVEDFEILVGWLYNGSLFTNSRSFANPWSIARSAMAIWNGNYFDVPSLKKCAIEQCVNDLRDSAKQYKYAYGSGLDSFTDAFKIIFEMYETHRDKFDPILRALKDKSCVRIVLENKELRPLLEKEPRLMVRLLEIETGARQWDYDFVLLGDEE